MDDVRHMQLGQVVGFVDDYNKRQKKAEQAAERKKSSKKYRFATPKEISSYTRS